MVTRITRILLLLQLAVAVLLAQAALASGRIAGIGRALAFGIAVVLLVRMAITANNFFLARRFRSETPDALRLNWWTAARLFAGEFCATMLSSSWTMAFHRFDKHVAGKPAGLPVLLIHGYGCNSGYWHAMSRALRRAGITHYAVDLEPLFADIDDYAGLVDEAVRTLCSETGQPKIVIVAHSMGGLVARAYLRRFGTDRVARVITLGTPHNGTGLANFGVGANSQQMRWQPGTESGIASAWLRELQSSETPALRALFVSIYSHHDNIISPQLSSRLEGAANIEFHGIGHVALALNRRVQDCVVREILAASDRDGQSPRAHPAQAARCGRD